jgi:HSP20 family protein
MDDFWNRFFEEMPLGSGPMAWTPAVDVSETDGRILVKAELPGLEAKDISVDVDDNVLTLRGEKKMEEEEKNERYYCRERFVGSFQRSFRLPGGVRSEQVKAKFKNGVLQIEIPKPEGSQQKRVQIEST